MTAPASFLSLCLSLTLLCFAHAALAQPVVSPQQTEARTHFQTGARHYQDGQFSQAITEFETAYRLFPSPVILFNLAQAYRSDGRLSEAVSTFRRFLETAERVSPEQRRDVETTVAEIEATRASLTFEIEPAGATLSLDGRLLGTLPLARALELTPGEHQIVITLANHQTRRDEITLRVHERRLYNATLLRVAQNSRITINATPPGASISLDGSEVGQGQSTQQIAPGEHTVTVTFEGYLPQTRTVRVAPLGAETLSVDLVRRGRLVFTRPVFWAVVGGAAVIALLAVLIANPPSPTPILGNSNPAIAQTVFSF